MAYGDVAEWMKQELLLVSSDPGNGNGRCRRQAIGGRTCSTTATPEGDVAEWSNAPVSKTGMGKPIRGSNPLVSAHSLQILQHSFTLAL